MSFVTPLYILFFNIYIYMAFISITLTTKVRLGLKTNFKHVLSITINLTFLKRRHKSRTKVRRIKSVKEC